MAVLPIADVVHTAHEIVDVAVAALWPLLAVFIVIRLFPSIRRIVDSRSFQLKLGGAELSVQEASDQVKKQIDDLQTQVLELRAKVAATGSDSLRLGIAGGGSVATPPRPVLWVDDQAAKSAFEKARLRELGFALTEARSTDEALHKMTGEPLGVIVTGSARVEDGTFVADAGLRLLRAVRQNDDHIPVYFYTSSSRQLALRQAALKAGATAVTSSPTELLELVSNSPLGRAIALDQQVAQYLADSSMRIVQTPGGLPDYVVSEDGRRLGIESRGWDETTPAARVQHVFERLDQARIELKLDAVLIVTPGPFPPPTEVAIPDWVTFVDIEALRVRLLPRSYDSADISQYESEKVG
jgi:CheY-like chemotaxis protein